MFRTLQFNIQFGMGWNDATPDAAPTDIAATIAEIKRHEADLILLQEVEHALPGGVQVEPPPNYGALKAGLPDYDSWFSYPRADPRELPFGLGLAIFSRTPLEDRVRVDIPSPPIEFEFAGKTTTPTDRVMIGARTKLDGRDIQVFNVHLLAFFMLGSSSTTFPWQRNLVADYLEASETPTLLGGDFNVSQHETLISQFAVSGYSPVQRTEVTWRRRPYVLDHIFYNRGLRCVKYAVEATMASDHHALVADFEFV